VKQWFFGISSSKSNGRDSHQHHASMQKQLVPFLKKEVRNDYGQNCFWSRRLLNAVKEATGFLA